MSGQDAQRGFIYQTIIAMIECLKKDDWDAIKLEPKTQNHKVDIFFYKQGMALRAIQVKSSRNEFSRSDVEKWLVDISNDAESAQEVCLCLVGTNYTQSCYKYIESINKSQRETTETCIRIEKVDYSHIKETCFGSLVGYIKTEGLAENIKVSDLDLIYASLFTDVHENSIAGKVLSRTDFQETFFRVLRAIRSPQNTLFSENSKNSDLGKEMTSRKANDSLEIAKSIRKLTNGLWVNWKTGLLDSDATGALLEEVIDGATSPSREQKGDLPIRLTRAELRMLSVLVQGEGAVVSWDELYHRGFIMSKEIEGLEHEIGSSCYENGIVFSITSEGANSAHVKANGASFSPMDEKTERMPAKEAVSAMINKLCSKVPTLAKVLKPAENGKGYRIMLAGTGIESAAGCFPEEEGPEAVDDWNCLDAATAKNTIPHKEKAGTVEKNGYMATWLRRCYAETCGTFEKRVSNAAGRMDTEADTFGDYTMIESYMNAYSIAKDPLPIRREALLDYVEKWYFQRGNGKQVGHIQQSRRTKYSCFGKVLVLHGQPGDGKTTFCKKAVYARCFEGWLGAAPHVLRINLNPQHAGGAIFTEGRLDLTKIMCLYNAENNRRFSCDPLTFGVEGEGSLIILDGYDELASSFNSATGVPAFQTFCEAVSEFAFNRKWNIIITSRTMCIETELDDIKRMNNVDVAEFVPMTEEQQDLLIERMAELQQLYGNHYEANLLRDYQANVLPQLRNAKDVNIGRFLAIPILFRMIVSCKFRHIKGIDSPAELYSNLFFEMMKYKNRGNMEKKELLRDYEEIAARIFLYNGNNAGDTCPYGEELGDRKRELVYLFLTKNNQKEMGHLGFLHREFYQYFLASYLVSGIQGTREVGRFFRSLRAYPIVDQDVWRLVAEIIQMKRKGADPFSKEGFTKYDIERALEYLNEENTYVETLIGEYAFVTGKDAEHRGWNAAEQAVKNLMNALSIANMECLDEPLPSNMQSNVPAVSTATGSESESDTSSGFGCFSNIREILAFSSSIIFPSSNSFNRFSNLCEILRRGKYKGINLEGMDLSGASLEGADFSGACLRNALLLGANLTGAVLKEADLTHAVLTGAHLTGADLSGAILEGAILEAAHLEKSYLEGTNLRDARLMGACLSNAHMDGAFLAGSDLTGAHMDGAFMRASYLEGTIPDYSEERNEHTSCGAILDGADLQGASLHGAFLSKEQYIYAKQRNALGLSFKVSGGRFFMHSKFLDLVSKGKIIFGSYWQEWYGDEVMLKDDDKTPLSWKVIYRAYDKILIVTEKLIDSRPYNNEFKETTWEKCDLRRWLNEDFFYEAFDEEERSRIALVCNRSIFNKSEWSDVKYDRPTWDRVFLLSHDELSAHLPTVESRATKCTKYAKEHFNNAKYQWGEEEHWWWLRSPGKKTNALCVAPSGNVLGSAFRIDYDTVFVRPALWLNLL